jgi:hypothetical protein
MVRVARWVPIVTYGNFREISDALTAEANTPGATDVNVEDAVTGVARYSPEHGMEIRSKAAAHVANLYRELPKPPAGMHPKLWNPTVLEITRFDAYSRGYLDPVGTLNSTYTAHPKSLQAVRENYPAIWQAYAEAVHYEVTDNQDSLADMPLQHRQKLLDTFGVPVSMSDTPLYQAKIHRLYREQEVAEQEMTGKGMAPRAKDAGKSEATLLDALSKPPGN